MGAVLDEIAIKEFILSRKADCAKRLEAFRQGSVEDGELSRDFSGTHYTKLPTLALELDMWRDFETGGYWHGKNSLKVLLKREDNPFTQDDVGKLAEVAFAQMLSGKSVAQLVPRYHAVWTDFLAEDSPFRQFVTDEHKEHVINTGLWHLLAASGAKDIPVVHDAGKELTQLFSHSEIFSHFDYANGVREAQKLSDKLDLGTFAHWQRYMVWYLTQETFLYEQLQRDQAAAVGGRLAAPLINALLGGLDGDVGERERMRELARYFIKGDLIKTAPVQDVLGAKFERQLEKGFKNDPDRWSVQQLEGFKRSLQAPGKHVAAAWARAQAYAKDWKQPIDLTKLDEEIQQYVPKAAFEAQIVALKDAASGMKRFERVVFGQWMRLRPEVQVDKGMHGRVRNKMLDVYYMQSHRPSTDDVLALSAHAKHWPKLDGYLFADLLLRRLLDRANDILLHYDQQSAKPRENFMLRVKDCVQEHGAIPMLAEALDAKACYPEYNRIAEFHKHHPGLFKIKG